MSKVDDQPKKSMDKTHLNKKLLTKLIAQRSGLQINETQRCIDALIEIFAETMETGGKIALKGMGTFQVCEYGERLAYNPSLGEHIVLPVHKRLKFIPSAMLRI